MLLSLRDIKKTYRHFALNVESLEIKEGTFLTIIGPSGAGKTTLLGIIGGFIKPDAGTVIIDGIPVSRHVGRRRAIRTVFQNLALFPHLTVRQQLVIAARLAYNDNGNSNKQADFWIGKTRLEEVADYRPEALAGGQKQRLALARALIANPKLLLLDEPTSALDYSLRAELWSWVEALTQGDTKTAFIVITHDPDIALSRSDLIAVLDKGKLVQVGTPQQIYEEPASQDIAGLLGPANIVRVGGGDMVVRPERVDISPLPLASKEVSTKATIIGRTYYGDWIQIALDTSYGRLLARRPSEQGIEGVRGDVVYVGWDKGDARPLSSIGGTSC